MNNPWDFLDEYRGKEFAGEWPTLPELFRISVARYADRPCFSTYDPEHASLTYAEALGAITKAAEYLRSIGIRRGDKVAVTGKNSPEWAVAYLAVLFADAVVVPIDYQLRDNMTENILKASDSKVLFVDEEKWDLAGAGSFGPGGKISLAPSRSPYVLRLPDTGDAERPPTATATGPLAATRAGEGDLAAILYTSGTTGTPKGVMLTHRNFVSDCFLAQDVLRLYPTDVFYALLPIHHSYTMLAVFIEALSVGAEVVFGKRMVTKQIFKDLKEGGVTMFLAVPMLFNKVLQGIMKGIREKGVIVYGLIRFMMWLSGMIKKAFKANPGKRMFGFILEKVSLNSIRICISGGGPLAASVFRQFNQLGIDFVQGYGLTETSPILTLNPTDRYKETSVGRLLPRTEIKILDPDERGAGEIAVKGPMVMSGYYKMDDETKQVFTEDGWFKTGDVGFVDAENYVYLTGRAKNLIVTEGGKNVYPEEIEDSFQLYGEVEQVLVRGFIIDKRTRSEGIEALIYPNRDLLTELASKSKRVPDGGFFQARIGEIVNEVNARLLPYQKIARFKLLDERMEETTTKKIKRFALS